MTCPKCDTSECKFGEDACVCESLGEYCYSEFTYTYDIFLASLFLLQGYNLIYASMFTLEILRRKVIIFCPTACTDCCSRLCCRCCCEGGEEGRVESTSTRNLMKSQRRFSAMEIIILLTFFGLIIRLTWVVTVINGRTASVVLVDQYTESILLKVPQILWMSAFLYTALVWRRLADKCSSLTGRGAQSSKAAYQKLSYKVNGSAFILIIVVIPMYMYGMVYDPMILMITDHCLLLVCLVVILLGIRFGRKLIWQLQTTILGGEIIPTIRFVVFASSSSAILLIVCAVAYNLKMREKGRMWAMGYSTIVHHVCEFTLVYALLATKKSSRRRVLQQQGASRPSGINVRAASVRSSSQFNAMKQSGGAPKKTRKLSKRERSDEKMRKMERKFERPEVMKTTQALI